jgi:transposase-like protein
MFIMPPRKRRSYTAEYKVEAAHRVIDTGRTISEVVRELGIDAGMLSVWVKDERRRVAAAEVQGEKLWRRPSGPSCCDCVGRWPSWRRTTRSW